MPSCGRLLDSVAGGSVDNGAAVHPRGAYLGRRPEVLADGVACREPVAGSAVGGLMPGNADDVRVLQDPARPDFDSEPCCAICCGNIVESAIDRSDADLVFR